MKLGAKSVLVNEAGGVITGADAGVVAGSGDVITNDGVITGLTGIQVNGDATIDNAGAITASGDTISLNGGISTVTLDIGTQITGAIAEIETASLIDLTDHGSLSGDITGLQAVQ
jgi:hypothetical protein